MILKEIIIPDTIVLDFNDLKQFQDIIDFAIRTEQVESLQKQLDYLGSWSGKDKDIFRCVLYYDFAPMSFGFVWQGRNKETKAGTWDESWSEWRTIMNGGCIYHGSHDGGGDGSAPTYSVNLTPVQGWSIHT